MMTRRGYSILEMMIALSLLGVLLVTAWSLLENYRKAEQRSWALVEQIQAVRVPQSWLQNDLLHLHNPADIFEANSSAVTPMTGGRAANLSTTQSNKSATGIQAARASSSVRFEGTPTGFTTLIDPSTDPTMFMQQLFENESDSDSLSNSPTDFGRSDDYARTGQPDQSGGSLVMQQVELSYELRQTGEDSAASGNSAIVYQLIRREGAAHTQQSSTFSGTSSGRAERVLTSQDLYRLSDDEKESGTVLHQHAIDGLVDAQFWYFDGQAWSSNWQDGSRYPKAVALSYDLPSKRGVVPIPRSDLSGGQLFNGDLANSSSALQSLASEVTLDGQSEDFESLQKDIKLIVRVPGQSYVANSNATQLRLNGKLQGVAQ